MPLWIAPSQLDLSGTKTHPQRIATVNANTSDGGTEPHPAEPAANHRGQTPGRM
jgi:hypothetical protein